MVGKMSGEFGKTHKKCFETIKGPIKDIMNAINVNVIINEKKSCFIINGQFT
jgi:hypothetical protein